MPTLKIHNPATGSVIDDIAADDATSVAAKATAARAAQPAWAALPMAERLACITRFRAAVVAQLDDLAATMTRETGKPISLSRNELNGLLPRLDFFVEQAEGAVRDEHVFDGGGMHEQISHAPLGVVANISAWNYPWFVGGNVFVPALLTGNAVLYKPSEYATLTGLAMARLLHAAGVPEGALQLLHALPPLPRAAELVHLLPATLPARLRRGGEPAPGGGDTAHAAGARHCGGRCGRQGSARSRRHHAPRRAGGSLCGCELPR
jgi:acyl-CoA reductase-like NAD-dependent aldehyde dehydrogenase